LELSSGPPTIAVLPSEDNATETPCPVPPVPTSLFPCWVHTPPLRVNTHAAPTPPLSLSPPKMAVLPSAYSATEWPCVDLPVASLPTSLLPCWGHTPPLLVKAHAAAAFVLSPHPPTTAGFAS